MTEFKINLKEMMFFGYHGTAPEEKALGQKFIVDLEIWADVIDGAKEDDLEKTVNYVEIYNMVKEIVENNDFKLLEALALNITENIFLLNKKISKIHIRIKKPSVPIPGMTGWSETELLKERE
ncbi:MAG: dihydroneopterin aldolase [Candidatus Muiribacterium halophilum]|uniref:7,8-dihydroneopterin aldolase n=1 Tax=Muiribacterium halophilum TaxID=2053465 RepID=A0A2N5Z9D2_MUIH1|nr:MAG: dihydroneopterin aldolase [Candidatus Muirbacterium halophilum]